MLDANVLATSTPDLHTLYLKRSIHPVHYAYLHHSLVSSHMIYTKEAFRHFDTIFCVGPHHVHETRAAEEAFNWREKNLVKHGYGRLDQLLLTANSNAECAHLAETATVLVAPSWGPNGLFETHAGDVVEILLKAGFSVIARPHPMTWRTHGKELDSLKTRFQADGKFTFDDDVSSAESLARADIMVSDWSGAALEFAFGFEKPVLFVDTPRKVNNPDYEQVSSPPIEVALREEIGSVLSSTTIDKMPAEILDLLNRCADGSFDFQASRQHHVFNVGVSAKTGAGALIRIADELEPGDGNR
jgi:YidC/Oxa1 family membrane protein insertase